MKDNNLHLINKTYSSFLNPLNIPNSFIDYENIDKLSINAISCIKTGLVRLDSINEIDQTLNYKKKFKQYILSSLEVDIAIKNYFKILKYSKDDKTIQYYKDQLFKKLRVMKYGQIQYDIVEKMFCQKYDI